MHEQYAYLSSTDFTRIAADLLPLLDAVLEHSDTLRPEIVKVYRPHPLARRLASTVVRSLPGKVGQRSFGERPISEMLGYRFSDPDHPDIVGRIDRGQTAGTAIVMRQNLAALFEMQEVLVMDAIYNSAIEGASNSHGFIGGKHALLAYRAPSPGIMILSWSGRCSATS